MSADAMAELHRLWQLYLTLSQELLKFIDRQDIDEFLALVEQREQVVQAMQAQPAESMAAWRRTPECAALLREIKPLEMHWRRTPECAALLREIKPLEMQTIYKAKAWLNKSRRNTAQVRAYELTAGRLNPLGNIVNRKY